MADSPAIRGSPTAQTLSNIPTQNGSGEEQTLVDVLTLVADFLERSTCLKETAATLREEVQSTGLLATSINWKGEVTPGKLPDHRSLRSLPKDALLRVLVHLTRSQSPLDLEHASVLAATVATLTKESRETMESKQKKALRKKGQSASKDLVDTRLQRRQLIREMASDRGRSSNLLVASLQSVSKKIQSLASSLALVPQLRRQSGCNIVDALTEPHSFVGELLNAKSINRVAISQLKILKKMFAHREAAFCASASNSKWLFTGADDNVVKMWNGQNARLHYSFRGHKNVITDLSTTDELIASASEDNSVRVWDIGSSRPFAVFTQHKQPVQRVHFSNDGSTLFTSAEDGACCVWNIEALRLQVNDRKVNDQAWLERERERRRHAALTQGTARGTQPQLTPEQQELQMLIDCPRNPLIFEPPLVFPHCGPPGLSSKVVKIVCMAVHPSGKFVATGAEDCLGRVWSVEEISSQPLPPSAATLPELITGEYRDGASHLMCTLSGHTAGFVHHIEWSHRGDRILTFSDKDGTARIWFWPLGDFASKPQHIALKAIVGPTMASGSTAIKPSSSRSSAKAMPMMDGAGFSCDDRLVVTTQSTKPAEYKDEEPGFWDSRVCVWDSKTGLLLRFMRGHRMQVNIVRTHPFLDYVAATCGADGLMIFWDVSRGEELTRVEASSQWGHASILDARWSVNQNHSCDFIATDSIGRLLLIGTSAPRLFAAAPNAQFFSNETDTFIADTRTNEPMDSTLQIPLYLMTTPPMLVNYQVEPYEHQPPIILKGEGSFFGPPASASPPDNYLQRIEQAERMERDMILAEAQFYQQNKHLLDKQDEAILAAMDKDREEQNGNGTTLTSPVAKIRKPRSTNAAHTAPPRLKYEEEIVSVDESEEDDDEEDDAMHGRSRRAAARKATRKIHRHARILGDAGVQGDDGNDPNFIGNRPRLDEEEEEDEDAEDDDEDQDDEDEDDEDDLEDEDEDEEDGNYGTRTSGRRRRRRRRRYDDESIPRKVYETRKRRPDYSKLERDEDDDNYDEYDHKRQVPPTRSRRRGASDDDDSEDGSSNRRRNPARGNVRGGSTTVATSSIAPQVSGGQVFSDDWLTYAQSPFAFVPQVGDAVVYFPQGHAEYLQHFPSTESPPWRAWNGREWPYVCCRVTDIEYQFPQKEEPIQILCKLNLRVTHVKGGQSASLVPLPSSAAAITFSVLYHSFEPEFLVLLERFLAGLKQGLKPGDPIRCFANNPMNPMEPSIINAVIKDIEVRSPDDWPDSPWECLVCTSINTDGDGGEENETLWVSPWDAELDTDDIDTVPLWSVVAKESVAFREAMVHQTDQVVGEYIAEQMEDCPLWTAFRGTTRRKPGLPCLINMVLVTERLRSGTYYRQFEAIAFDLRVLVECCLLGTHENHPLRKKSPRFLAELTDILNIAKFGKEVYEPASSGTVRIVDSTSSLPVASITVQVRLDTLRTTLIEAVELVAAEDKEEFFAEPVDLSLFPDYTQYVMHPMDYQTIRQMIQSHSFGSFVIPGGTQEDGDRVPIHIARSFIRDVIHDVRLVSDNAMKYNMEGSMAFRRAKECFKKMTQVFSELDPELMETKLSVKVNTAAESYAAQSARVSSSGRQIRAPARDDAAENSGADSLLNDDSAEDQDSNKDPNDSDVEVRHRARGSSGRPRGRPKGSVNKTAHKDNTARNARAAARGVPRVHSAEESEGHVSEANSEPPVRRGRGRPKGSGVKRAIGEEASPSRNGRGRPPKRLRIIVRPSDRHFAGQNQEPLQPATLGSHVTSNGAVGRASTRLPRASAATQANFEDVHKDLNGHAAVSTTTTSRPRRGQASDTAEESGPMSAALEETDGRSTRTRSSVAPPNRQSPPPPPPPDEPEAKKNGRAVRASPSEDAFEGKIATTRRSGRGSAVDEEVLPAQSRRQTRNSSSSSVQAPVVPSKNARPARGTKPLTSMYNDDVDSEGEDEEVAEEDESDEEFDEDSDSDDGGPRGRRKKGRRQTSRRRRR